MVKIVTILGTRPEIIRLSETIKKLDTYTNHVLVFTNQSYDYRMGPIFFDELGIREPDHTLNVKAGSVGQQIGNILSQCEKTLVLEKPDAVLVLGDTNSALSCIIAKRMGIPVFHMEGGNRCWDNKVPEEVNRRIIDHTADINLCYTEHARRNLLREGLHPGNIYVLGSPLPEVYGVHREAIQRSKVLEELGLVEKRYLLASIHREENVSNEQRLLEIIHALGEAGKECRVPIILSTHPRTRTELSQKCVANNGVILHAPFGMLDYIRLQLGSLCCLSDSGTIHEDAAILGITAVNVRDSQERPETYDAGNIIMSGVEEDSIAETVRIAIAQADSGMKFSSPPEYIATNYSDKAVRIILSALRGRMT